MLAGTDAIENDRATVCLDANEIKKPILTEELKSR
jgi:hypothetical protein